MNNSLGEAGRSGGEEENSLGVGLSGSELEVLRALLGLAGLLDITEQLDVQTSGTGLIKLTRSDLVSQPDGLHAIGSQEGVEVLNVSLAVVELGGEVGEETRDEAGAESGPNGQHIILVGGQVDNNDGLLASGGGTDGGRTEGGHERVGNSLDGGFEPGDVVDLGSRGRSNKGKRLVSVGLSSPREQLGESVQVR